MQLYEATKAVLRIFEGSHVVWSDLRKRPTIQEEIDNEKQQSGDGSESERD